MRYQLSRRHLGRWAGAMVISPWLASCGAVGESDVLDPKEREYIRVVESVFADYRPPGALVGVRLAGEAPWMRAFGKADLGLATQMALNSTFPIRSITKSFTVTLLLQLVQSGELELSDKIGRYIAGVPNGNLISLADLAGNQSGLADYSMQPGFIQLMIEDPLRTRSPQELAVFAFSAAPSFLPGEKYQYCNTNTLLLGMLIESVTGRPLAEVLADKIFKPLGLEGTSYPSSAELPLPAPTPYLVDINSGLADQQPLLSPSLLAGAGGVTSTLSDLLVWGEALGQGSLLSPELQAVRKSSAREATGGPEYDYYGLGIGQIGQWWGHTGSGVGFQIATMNLASSNATVSVMVNATPEGSRRDFNLAQELFERMAAVVEAG